MCVCAKTIKFLQHHQDLVSLQSSITEQVRSLQQLRELLDNTRKPLITNNDSLDLVDEIRRLKIDKLSKSKQL